MYISKTSPVSEDRWIDRYVKSMEKHFVPADGDLNPIWDVTTSEVKFYGRADTIDGKDYWYSEGNFKDILTDNKFKFISYIRTNPDVGYRDGKYRVTAALVCQGNLKSLYPTITHRADAEIRSDVISHLFRHFDNQLNFTGYTIIDQDKMKDMQPFHTFELNFIIAY